VRRHHDQRQQQFRLDRAPLALEHGRGIAANEAADCRIDG
jgi:hypothetical protein